jgi:hypothetical protein
MSMMIAAVGVDSSFAVNSGGPDGLMVIGGLVLMGVALLLAAGHLCRGCEPRAHASPYTAPRR